MQISLSCCICRAQTATAAGSGTWERGEGEGGGWLNNWQLWLLVQLMLHNLVEQFTLATVCHWVQPEAHATKAEQQRLQLHLRLLLQLWWLWWLWWLLLPSVERAPLPLVSAVWFFAASTVDDAACPGLPWRGHLHLHLTYLLVMAICKSSPAAYPQRGHHFILHGLLSGKERGGAERQATWSDQSTGPQTS